MLKLIHADLYRCFHRLYLYLLAGALAGLCLLLSFQFRRQGDITAAQAWTFALTQLFGYPLLVIPMLPDIVFTEESREHTLKNTVAFGVSRVELYVSKALTAILLGLLLAAAALAVYCGGTLLLLPRGPVFAGGLAGQFFGRFAALCSVYVGAVAVAALFTVFLHRGALAVFVYYAAVYMSRYLFPLLHLPKAADYLLVAQVRPIVSGAPDAVRQAVLISLATLAAFLTLGAACFRRRDVA